MVSPAAISYANYGFETEYAAVSTQITKTFGHGEKITTLSRKNNIERVIGMGARNAQVLAPKRYEGLISDEFILANPWFFYAAMGTAGVTGSGPYTHTFSEADTTPSMTILNEINSDTESVAKLLGAKINTMNITTAVNELVKVKLDMPYANETHSTTTAANVAESFDLYTFAEGSLQVPSGSTIAQVQSAELSMVNNYEPVWGIGSRFAQAGPVKSREYTANTSLNFQQQGDFLDKVYGATTGPGSSVAETATMVMTFTNGSTGTNERSITMTYAGVQVEEDNLPQDPEALIQENVALHMRSLSVVAINNTATIP